MSLAPASQTIRIIHCILEWVNLIFTGLKNEKSKSVEALKSAKSVLIFLPEFASHLGIVELFTRKLFPSLRSLRCPLLSKLSILFVVLSTFDLELLRGHSQRKTQVKNSWMDFRLRDVTEDLKEAMSTWSLTKIARALPYVLGYRATCSSVGKNIFSPLWSEREAHDYFSALTFYVKVSSCKERTEMSKKSLGEELTCLEKFLGDNYSSTRCIKNYS